MLETRVQCLGQEDPLKGLPAHSVFLPGEFHGQKSWTSSLVHGVTQSDKTERLTHTHTYCKLYTINVCGLKHTFFFKFMWDLLLMWAGLADPRGPCLFGQLVR